MSIEIMIYDILLQVAQGVSDTLVTINLLKIDIPTQKEVSLYNRNFVE